MVGVHTVALVSTSGVSAGKNLMPNPSFETGTANTTASRGTITRTAIPRPVGGAWGVTYAANGTAGSNYVVAAGDVVTAGRVYTASAYVEPYGEGTGTRWRIWLQWWNTSNANVGEAFGPWVSCPAGTMTRVAFTPAAAPAGAVQARVIVISEKTSIPAGSGWYLDGIALNEGPDALPYFDGSTANTALYHYGWTGTAHASASIRNVYIGADLSCLVDDVSIAHGRDDSGSQPSASSVTVNFTATPLDPLPAGVEIGAPLAVETQTPAGTFARFVGRITDLALGWDEAGEATPDNGVGQLVAVGPIADLGRAVVGAVPFPQELDGARVARVLSAAGVTLDPLYSDPGTALILARDIDATAALDAAHDAATSASGVLWQTRAGVIRYADADHRRGIPSSLTLDACDVLVTPTWRRTLEGLVNAVSIGYGVAPDGGEAPRFVEDNAASIAQYGRYGYDSSTDLATADDAAKIGRLLLARNSSPVWVMSSLPVDVAGLDESRYDALLGLDLHGLVTLTGLPSLGTAPTSAVLWVEGWHETLAAGVHDVELVVSGYCRTVPPPRWDDVDPAWLWGDTPLTETRRNLITNPSAEIDTAGWGAIGTGSTLARGTLTAPAGVAALVVTLGTVNFGGAYTNPPLPATAGVRYGFRASVRCLDVAAEVYARMGFWDDAGQLVVNDGALVTPPLGSWREVTVEGTAPAGTTRVYCYVERRFANATAGHRIAADAMLLTVIPAGSFDPTYFDGDTADTEAMDYAWAGTPHASVSVESVWGPITPGLPPTLTWDEAACLGPPANYGRWNDQPASLRWNQLTPSTTWNNYR